MKPDRIIYKSIEFSSMNLAYNLTFKNYFTLIVGDSGTGKTFLFNRLRDLKQIHLYDKLRLYNAESEDFESIYDCKNSFIVIDNFDILVSDELRNFLQLDKTNQFLVFGRNTDGLPVDIDSFVYLNNYNGNITLEAVFDGLFMDGR